MSTERDTKFQGFAEGVAKRLQEEDLLNIGNYIRPLSTPPLDFDYERVKQILACHAYDLVKYAYHFVDCIEEPLTWDEILQILPDPITWTERRED